MSAARPAERRLVLGIGNPILGDDGVGWLVAQAVAPRLAPGVEVDCVAVGGLALMERLVGYDDVVLVDAIHGSGDAPGTVRVRTLEEIPGREASHLDSAHDVPVRVALDAGRALGAHLPARIAVVSVEADRVDTFGEVLTPAVEAAVPLAMAQVEWLVEDHRPGR